MAHLGIGRGPPEVKLDHMARLVERIIGTANKCSQVGSIIRHRRILPIDEIHLLAAHEEVRAVEVVVAQARLDAVRAHERIEHPGVAPELLAIGKRRVALPTEKLHDRNRVAVRVEGPLAFRAAVVQAAAQLHRTAHMVLVVVVEGNAAVDEARDLPAFGGVLVDEGVVDAKLLRDDLRKRFACTVDDLVGAHTWVAIDIRLAAHHKAKRQVREPLLDGHDALDVAARAFEHAADVVKDRRVDVLDEVVVELLQVGNGVELIDHARLVRPHDHAQLVEVRAIDVLPQLASGFGPIVLVDKDSHESFGERAVEVHVPEHTVLVTAADGHARDAPVARGVEQILVRLAREEHARVIGLEHVGLEDVFGEIIVRRADVSVPQLLAHEHKG